MQALRPLSICIIAILVASMAVPTALAASSTQSTSSITLNQLRMEALLAKIMLEKVLSTYKVPISLRKEVEQLVSVNISKLSEEQLQQYIDNATKLIEEIEKVGSLVNVLTPAIVMEHVVNVTISRSIEIAKRFNVSINISVNVLLRNIRSGNYDKYREIISVVDVQVATKLLEILITKMIKIANEITKNISLQNLTKVEKVLTDIVKMMQIVNRSVEHMQRVHMKKVISKSVVKELEKLMKKMINASKELHRAMEKVKEFKCTMRKKYLRKLMILKTKILKMIKVIEQYEKYTTNETILKTLKELASRLSEDLKLINNATKSNINLEQLIYIIKKVENDVKKVERYIMEIAKEIEKSIEKRASSMYKKFMAVVRNDESLIKLLYNLSKEMNSSTLEAYATKAYSTIRSLANNASRCMELENAAERIQCLRNITKGLVNVSIGIVQAQEVVMKNVSMRLIAIEKNLSSVANVTKNVTLKVVSMLKSWVNKVKNAEVRINASMRNVLRSRNASQCLNQLMKLTSIALSACNTITKIVIEINIVKKFAITVSSIENLNTEFVELVKKAKEKGLSNEMVKKLINEIKNLFNEILRYLMSVYESMKKCECAKASHVLEYIANLLKKLEQLIKELEQLVEQSSGQGKGFALIV